MIYRTAGAIPLTALRALGAQQGHQKATGAVARHWPKRPTKCRQRGTVLRTTAYTRFSFTSLGSSIEVGRGKRLSSRSRFMMATAPFWDTLIPKMTSKRYSDATGPAGRRSRSLRDCAARVDDHEFELVMTERASHTPEVLTQAALPTP